MLTRARSAKRTLAAPLVLGALVSVACGSGGDGPQPTPSPGASCPAAGLADVEIVSAPGEQLAPKVALAPDGHTWVTWFSLENGNGNLRAQRLDPSGQRSFSASGLLVSNQPSASWVADYSLAVDPDGAAIVAVNDVRRGNFDAYAYKLTAAGESAWDRNGLLLSRSSDDDDLSPTIAMSTNGEAVILWPRLPADKPPSFVAQRLSRDGRFLWGDGLVVTGTRAPWLGWGLVAPADNGAVVLVWTEGPALLEAAQFILARKLDARGQALWPADVVVAESQTISYYQKPALEPDGEGGAFVAWSSEVRDLLHVFVQHVDKDGRLTMPAGGVQASLSTTTHQVEPGLAFVPNSREVVVAWSERSGGQGMRGLSAQRVTFDGTKRWGSNGSALIPPANYGPDLAALSSTAEAALLVYGEPTSPGAQEMRILGARLPLLDAPPWTPSVLSARVSRKGGPAVGGTRACGAWAVWQDEGADEGDIRGSFLSAR